jgi:hypothetical protein
VQDQRHILAPRRARAADVAQGRQTIGFQNEAACARVGRGSKDDDGDPKFLRRRNRRRRTARLDNEGLGAEIG